MIGLVRPFEKPRTNTIEMFNEATILSICYCILTFTQFVPGAPEKYTMGHACVAVTLNNLFINVLILMKSTVKKLIKKLKRKYREAKRAAAIESKRLNTIQNYSLKEKIEHFERLE